MEFVILPWRGHPGFSGRTFSLGTRPLYKQEAQEYRPHTRRRRAHEGTGRAWSDVVTAEGEQPPGVSRGKGGPVTGLRGAQPSNARGWVRDAAELGPPAPQENTACCFKPRVCGHL